MTGRAWTPQPRSRGHHPGSLVKTVLLPFSKSGKRSRKRRKRRKRSERRPRRTRRRSVRVGLQTADVSSVLPQFTALAQIPVAAKGSLVAARSAAKPAASITARTVTLKLSSATGHASSVTHRKESSAVPTNSDQDEQEAPPLKKRRKDHLRL